uniref:Uncharacterized protein n=1 Tax=Meloidogyne hapla TaxID=6305 RepID=A0A1I8BAD6_MELHA
MPSTLNNLEENKELNEETRKNINEETYEDFPGIRRENRPKPEFIWRPEENQKDEEINEEEEEEELKNKNISINGEKLRKKRRDAKTTNLDLIERKEENKNFNKLENKTSNLLNNNKIENSTKLFISSSIPLQSRSPALKAIMINSLPVLPIGLLALGISLAIMLASLRPSSNAIK